MAFGIAFDLAFDEAIAAAEARGVQLPEDYYAQLQATARRAATTVSGLSGFDQIIAVIDDLTEALAKGEAFGEWQTLAELRGWQLPPGRLETIFRTNLQTAYNAGKWTQFQENAGSQPYLMWSAINDSRVRPSHLAMDGHIAPLDNPIWQTWHCPAGYNCRCTQVALTGAQAVARGYGRQTVPNAEPDAGFGGGESGDRTAGIAQAIRDRRAQVGVGHAFLNDLERGLAG